jgi:Na+/phosphate symporter
LAIHLRKIKHRCQHNPDGNPFIALFIGILATSIIQSSSTVISIIVGFVSSGVFDVGTAT